jgi:hypothetical protein
MKRRMALVFVGLLVFGALKLRFEQALAVSHRAAYFQTAKLDLGLREQIGQMGFIAALSGFRSLVADGLYIHAHTLFERTEWGRLKLDFDAITSLQPRAVLFWDQASWHMAYNAGAAALLDREQPREALRLKAQREYWRLGEDYLLRGIANNPDRPQLFEKLGTIYRDKFGDHCKAAQYFAESAKRPGAMQYVHRFAVYELAQCPGHEREAYEKLLELYNRGKEEQLPTLLRWLGHLQEELNIPAEQRVYIPPRAKP